SLVHLAEDIVQRDLGRLVDHGFALLVPALLLYLLHEARFDGEDGVARVGDVLQPEHGDGGRRTRLLDRAALVVDHGAHLADRRARDEVVARAQRTVLDEYARHGSLPLVEFGFDDDALRPPRGI